MIQNLDHGINKFKSLSFAFAKPEELSKNNSYKMNNFTSDEDYEIDKIIEKKLVKSKDLR
jgi:hypothetical protein